MPTIHPSIFRILASIALASDISFGSYMPYGTLRVCLTGAERDLPPQADERSSAAPQLMRSFTNLVPTGLFYRMQQSEFIRLIFLMVTNKPHKAASIEINPLKPILIYIIVPPFFLEHGL
jgi:hypothetical protein